MPAGQRFIVTFSVIVADPAHCGPVTGNIGVNLICNFMANCAGNLCASEPFRFDLT